MQVNTASYLSILEALILPKINQLIRFATLSCEEVPDGRINVISRFSVFAFGQHALHQIFWSFLASFLLLFVSEKGHGAFRNVSGLFSHGDSALFGSLISEELRQVLELLLKKPGELLGQEGDVLLSNLALVSADACGDQILLEVGPVLSLRIKRPWNVLAEVCVDSVDC